MSSSLDRRLNAYRPDKADIALKGQVEAGEFVSGTSARVSVPVTDLKNNPDKTSEAGSQILLGETVQVFERQSGWAWVQADRDRYVGYVTEDALTDPGEPATHRVIVPRTFRYSGPDLRFQVLDSLSMGSLVRPIGSEITRGTEYAVLEDGTATIASHIAPIEQGFEDYVSTAALFMETPYLWAGKSAFGFDCSGLVQLSMWMCGISVQRDSDMQAATIGMALEPDPNKLQRGDLVFWRGHVGIMEDDKVMLHASGHAMRVVREPLSEAIKRIAHLYDMPTAYRRP